MKTVGQILKQARIKQGWTVAQVAQKTKIRQEYLISLEADDYQALPSATYAKGFIKNYGEVLGLSTHSLIAVFRRDFVEDEQGQIIPRVMLRPQVEPKSWDRRWVLTSAGGFFLALLLGWLVFQYSGWFNPRLEVLTPENQEVVSQEEVFVSGLSDPTAKVEVNGRLVIVRSDGSFETSVLLPQTGENTIQVLATGRNGRTKQQVIKVFYQPVRQESSL